MADVLTGSGNPAPANVSGQVTSQAAAEAARFSRTGDVIKNRMPSMVKGAGYVGNGNTPLQDDMQILTKAHQATLDLRTETYRGYRDKPGVVKGLSGDFLNQFGYLKTALTAPSLGEQLSQVIGQIPGGADALGKSFTAGNLGIGSVK
jgi:hypothetical protein